MMEGQQRQAEAARQRAQQQDMQVMSDLAGYVRSLYEMFANHRTTNAGWANRLLSALRTFNGQYDNSKLAAIRQFGGSEIYPRIVAMKCRGATSLLRDVYLSPERAWAIGPPADPDVPIEVAQAVMQLVMGEMLQMAQAGMPVDQAAARDRGKKLFLAAREAEKANAKKRAKLATEKIEEMFVEGGLYNALAEFLVDLPLFPFACIKGPEVRIMPQVRYVQGKAQVTQQPRLCWYRISPFDLYWTPGAASIEQADVIERGRITRAELNDCLDLPGYNQQAVEAVLEEYGSGGITDDWDYTDTERALFENRENPRWNRSGMLNTLRFTGHIQGKMLLDYGMDEPDILSAPLRDFKVELWLIGRWVIKCQLVPSPRQRHPYYVTSFEKVPGTPVGNGLPDILQDIEDAAAATLRALVNNMSIASGPQVVIMDDRLAPGENGEQLFPWKRWHVQSDPVSNTNAQAPITFFSPQDNSQALLAVYQSLNAMADDISAIPKYMAGQGVGGGAGRTASGLAMLMGNASKILQTVAANIDRDIFQPLLDGLFDMLMLTDTQGWLQGDENIEVKGVNVAIQKETERARQLEFAQITANPTDLEIMGIQGRASLLRSLSNNIGMDGENIIPSEEQIDARLRAEAEAAAAQLAATPAQIADSEARAGGGGAPPEQAPPAQQQQQQGGGVDGTMGPRTDIAGAVG
jgi:hypothetical protein